MSENAPSIEDYMYLVSLLAQHNNSSTMHRFWTLWARTILWKLLQYTVGYYSKL